MPDYRVTDEALIAETAVWPNFFLMNVFFALKGSKLFIIICIFCAYTWTISGERLQDHWSSGLSIVLLRFISVIIQVSFGTQAPHILSAVVIRVGVNIAIQVLLADVSGGFPGVLPTYTDWPVSMSEIILKGTLN